MKRGDRDTRAMVAADTAGFRRGELVMLTKLIGVWDSLTERFRSEIEFAYLDGRRDEQEGNPENVGSLAHQDAAMRLMKTYLEALGAQGDVLLERLSSQEAEGSL